MTAVVVLRTLFLFFFFFNCTSQIQAGIYSAPVVLQGNAIRQAARYPLSSYRLFKTAPDGSAVAIPFQIDELNKFGDFVLDQGSTVTKNDGNGIFDLFDELSYMGDDVGDTKPPTRWGFNQPHLLFEIRHDSPDAKQKSGCVYIGIYFSAPPPLSKKSYVVFDPKQGQVNTSRYLYRFDQKNYLTVNGVDMVDRKDNKLVTPILDSSTFYLKADLKYFLTLEINQRDIQSSLEAYKVGPIRAIVRVTFFYRFLKINFELGMYTEVSLFSNSVLLPAIMYNPIQGERSLNVGSGFYYGFAVHDNPSQYRFDTNIPTYQPPDTIKQIFGYFKGPQAPAESLYWLSMSGKDRMMYFEVEPSAEMLKKRNIPSIYQEALPGAEVAKRNAQGAAQLGKSPVNLALYFDLAKFTEGEHRIAFRLFFNNYFSEEELSTLKTLRNWKVQLNRM